LRPSLLSILRVKGVRSSNGRNQYFNAGGTSSNRSWALQGTEPGVTATGWPYKRFVYLKRSGDSVNVPRLVQDSSRQRSWELLQVGLSWCPIGRQHCAVVPTDIAAPTQTPTGSHVGRVSHTMR
jgi:hypothetical protein